MCVYVYVCVREWEEGGSVCVHVCVCVVLVWYVCMFVCVLFVCTCLCVMYGVCVCVCAIVLPTAPHEFLAMAHSLGELWTARTLFSRGQQRKTSGQGYVMSHVIGSIMSVAQYRNVAYPEINLQMIKMYHLARTCAVFTVLCAMMC